MNVIGTLLLTCVCGGENTLPRTETGVVVCPQSAFRIPLDLTAEERSSVDAIRIFVSEDMGQSWVRMSDGAPDMKVITFRARHDGEYWFIVTLIDGTGKQTPSHLEGVEPGLKVLVDTTKPAVALKAIRSKSGRRGVRWTLDDPTVVPSSIQLAVWRADENRWEPFELRHPETGMAWFDSSDDVTRMQFSVSDQAGHRQLMEMEVMGEEFTKREIENFALDDRAMSATGLAQATPADASHASNIRQVRHEDREPQEPPAQDPSHADPSDKGTLCRSHDVVVNYSVDENDPAGSTERIEIWGTRDSGRTWTLVGVDMDGASPADAHLSEDGLWGLRIRVSTGATPSQGPKAGEEPDMYIEVDTTAPQASLGAHSMGPGEVSLEWIARDPHLEVMPIDLQYAINPGGPWKMLAMGLQNTGRYAWKAPYSLHGPVYFKMRVHDQAENVGESEPVGPIQLAAN